MRADSGGLSAFSNSVLGGFIGGALLLLAIFGGITLLVSSCTGASVECVEAGGSWDSVNGACIR